MCIRDSIHPYAAYDLKTCRECIEAHKYADPETMYRGEIGELDFFKMCIRDSVKIKIEPNPGKGYEFVNGIVGGAIPKEDVYKRQPHS